VGVRRTVPEVGAVDQDAIVDAIAPAEVLHPVENTLQLVRLRLLRRFSPKVTDSLFQHR
jgi:hypothetical protein